MGLKLGLSRYRKSMGCVFNRKMRKMYENKR
jgi:hypothetical protein